MDITLEHAILFALAAHRGQTDEDGNLHIVHSLEVMLAVKQECDKYAVERRMLPCEKDELLIAACLHDTVEDTVHTLDDIRREFGDTVATIVDGVTRRHGDPWCKLVNCTKHVKETYRDFIYRAAKNPASKLIKIADLNCNIRRAPQIKKASRRDKLEYKYGIALRVLLSDKPITWAQATFRFLDSEAKAQFGKEKQ